MSSQVVCVGLATLDSIFALPRHPLRTTAWSQTHSRSPEAARRRRPRSTLARLGVETLFVGAVGGDAAGDAIRTGSGGGRRRQRARAAVRRPLAPELDPRHRREGRAIVHFPGTAAPLEPSRRALELMREAELGARRPRRLRGCTSRRPALGRRRQSDRRARPRRASPSTPHAGGAERLRRRRPPSPPGRARRRHPRRRGLLSLHRRRRRRSRCPPRRVAGLVSTLGAGDVFHGALLARLRARPRARPRRSRSRTTAPRVSCRGARRPLGDPDAARRFVRDPSHRSDRRRRRRARGRRRGAQGGRRARASTLEWTELPWGTRPLPRARHDDAARTRWTSSARFDAVLLGAVGTRRFPTTSRSGGSCSRSARGSISGRTSGRRGCSTACPRRSPARPPSTCSSSARTPRASTRASAAARTRACRTRSGSRRPSSRAPASGAS